MTRLLRILFGLGLTCGALSFAVAALTGFPVDWILPILLGLGTALLLRLRPAPVTGSGPVGKAWPGQALTALGGWLVAVGLWLGLVLPGTAPGLAPWHAGGLVALGALLALWGLSRVLRHGAPSLAEAEMTARAARLGATVTLQVALIGGLLDFLDAVVLSGAQVGLGAATLGLLSGATANAFLTARAGY